MRLHELSEEKSVLFSLDRALKAVRVAKGKLLTIVDEQLRQPLLLEAARAEMELVSIKETYMRVKSLTEVPEETFEDYMSLHRHNPEWGPYVHHPDLTEEEAAEWWNSRICNLNHIHTAQSSFFSNGRWEDADEERRRFRLDSLRKGHIDMFKLR